MNENTKRLINNFLTLLTVLAVGVPTLFIVSKITSPQNKKIKDDITQAVSSTVAIQIVKPSLYPDYYAALTFSSTTIADNINTTAQSNNNFNPITKNLVLTGQFQRMYFLVQASVDNGKPLTVYDDIYLNLVSVNLVKKLPFWDGAHLAPTDSLPTPPSSISTLLYSANSLQLKQFSTSIKKQFDALTVFNKEKQLTIKTTLSSSRNGGQFSFIIYYECVASSTCAITGN